MENCFFEEIKINDLAIFIGNSGVYDTLTNTDFYTAEQVQEAINSAVEMYLLLMPCACKKAFEKLYRNLALSHIAIILSYNMNKNASAEQSETKSRVERDYSNLINEFKAGGLYYNLCNTLIVVDEAEFRPKFNVAQSGTFNPMGKNDRL